MKVIREFDKHRFVLIPTIAWSKCIMGFAGEEETVSHSIYFAWLFWVYEIEIELKM